MESSTIAPEDDGRTKSRRVAKSRDGHRSRSESHNIAKPLPKTPPASPPTQVQSSTLPEIAQNTSPPLIAPPPAVTRVPSSSRTPKVATSTSGHGHSRSTSILKVDMVKPGSNWDARLPHGGSRATPLQSPGASSDGNRQRGGSSNAQHSRNPSSDVEGRRTGPGGKTRGPSLDRQATRPSLDTSGAPASASGRTPIQKDGAVPRGGTVASPTSSRRGPSMDNRPERGRASSAQHSRAPSDSEGRKTAVGPPKIRGPIFDQENGPNQDGIEGSRPIIFDVESRIAGSSIRPVKKRGPSADPETRRPKVSASRDPSLDRGGLRPLDGSSPIVPNHRGPFFESNAEKRRPGMSASDSGHHNPWIKQPKAALRGKVVASASDSGHLNPQPSEGRRGPQGNPIRFNSTPTNPLINYRGYTPVPVNNVDDEEQGHGHETSTRLSHEKTLEDMPSFTLSRPYPGEKNADDPEKQKFKREMRRRHIRILLVSFAIIGLLILAIVLLVKFVRPKILTAIDTIGNDTSSSDNSTLSQEQTQCLSDFRTNATSDPTTYSCGACLPTLQEISPQFLQNSSNTNDASDIQSARQFCGLQAIFNSTGPNQAGLSTLGWMKNTQTCAWGGISCDASGAVSAMNLTFPAVPQTLPPQMSALTSLKRLQITGDRTIPSGPLISGMPASLQSLQLYNTHLEGLATADASWFQQNGGLSGLTELIMDGNPSLGSSLPSGLFSLPLQTLVARNQQLNMQLDELGNSGGIASAITTLDLSINNLSGTLGLLFLPHLARLDLSNNNLTSIPPILTWPSSLQLVHFQNNPTLNGPLASSLCANPSVTDCNFQATGFSGRNLTCGTCRF